MSINDYNIPLAYRTEELDKYLEYIGPPETTLVNYNKDLDSYYTKKNRNRPPYYLDDTRVKLLDDIWQGNGIDPLSISDDMNLNLPKNWNIASRVNKISYQTHRYLPHNNYIRFQKSLYNLFEPDHDPLVGTQ